MSKRVKQIAIFASGSGSNAESIVNYFKGHDSINVASIYTNRKQAGVLERAARLGIQSTVFTKKSFIEEDVIIKDLQSKNIDLIVLAGFLLLVPEHFIEAFPSKIVNIHPSLLPKYGGKGMYGMNVHKAVSESGDGETGITVHLVNKEFDKGKIISQIRCVIQPNEDPEKIAAQVLKIEHKYYPLIIDQLLENKYF